MGLPAKLVRRLTDLGLTEPTPIQARAIPEALNGHDVLGLAQTGTGKTAAFGLPLAALMMEYEGKPAPRSVRGLVLAPTRELAGQIAEHLKNFVKGSRLKVELVVGGSSINTQMRRLDSGVDLLVATPGRLLDLLDRGAVYLDDAAFLVLDEADQMLDLGFIHALRKIATLIPETRQTMLFSATMPKQMNEIASAYLKNPKRIQVSPPGKAADKVTQVVHFIAKTEKTALLIELVEPHKEDRTLVFSRTKHGAERIMKTLVKRGFKAASIHGNKSQGQRDRAIKAFKSGETPILVATDVAARGLDIPDVRFVYNFDLPNVSDSYVHRIGRTARAGADGAAIAFCAPDEMDDLKGIQKLMKMTIPVASGRPWEDLPDPTAKKPSGFNRGGPRRRQGGGGGGPKAEGDGAGGGGRPGGNRRRGPAAGKPGGGKPGGGKPGGGPRRGPAKPKA